MTCYTHNVPFTVNLNERRNYQTKMAECLNINCQYHFRNTVFFSSFSLIALMFDISSCKTTFDSLIYCSNQRTIYFAFTSSQRMKEISLTGNANKKEKEEREKKTSRNAFLILRFYRFPCLLCLD